jgi:DNA-binding transcriptional ArsR family regulator
MTTVFRPGIRRILQVFYGRKDEKIHLRELSRETGMYGQSISRYLKIMEKEKILKSEKDGNMKKYGLTHSQRTYSLLSCLDVEKLEKLPLLRRNAIKTFLQALPQPPVFAIVFGSTAKGNYREDSDIDILIITNKRIDAKDAEKEVSAQCSIRISTFQMEYGDFIRELRLKADKVIQSSISTGFPVMNQISYYEAITIE